MMSIKANTVYDANNGVYELLPRHSKFSFDAELLFLELPKSIKFRKNPGEKRKRKICRRISNPFKW